MPAICWFSGPGGTCQVLGNWFGEGPVTLNLCGEPSYLVSVTFTQPPLSFLEAIELASESILDPSEKTFDEGFIEGSVRKVQTKGGQEFVLSLRVHEPVEVRCDGLQVLPQMLGFLARCLTNIDGTNTRIRGGQVEVI